MKPSWDEVLAIACPYCGAEPGAFCRAGVGITGLPIPRRGHRSHRDRVVARRHAEMARRGAGASEPKKLVQCKTCPWRVESSTENIPNYRRDLHVGLAATIRSGIESMRGPRRIMACHYSKPKQEIPCAGWLRNQLDAGNNIGMRLAVLSGEMPEPEVDGDQHESFEDTIPPTKPERRRPKRNQ